MSSLFKRKNILAIIFTLIFIIFINISYKADSIVVPGAANDYIVKVGASYDGVMKLKLKY